jgi:hypothetical protein
MVARKEDTVENWITAKEAAAILSNHSGHNVSDAYVRRLGNPNGLAKIRIRQIDQRTRLYNRQDIETYQVQPRGDGSVRRAARKPVARAN